jgi:predicted transcriptional regulator
MSTKEEVLELVRRLPDEASMMDIAREIELVAGIREAMAQLNRGESVTAEELLREIPQWAGTSKSSK